MNKPMIEEERTLARQVLGVTEACNLSGVVHSMSTAVSMLWNISSARGIGTKFVNEHPVMVIYAERCATLTGYCAIGSLNTYGDALNACYALRDGKDA